ncbi:MAG: restriction endonuclease [Acidobacteria bacterium]|nr:MAG: restriction endonuclease [Acidobacteriota bacterium]
MTASPKTVGREVAIDATYHYPPELLELLADGIPALFKSKQGVIDFFRGAGVPTKYLADWQKKVRVDKDSVRKGDMARSILVRLNQAGESALRERREIVRRISEFDDFSTCWESDRYKAQGIVGQVRHVVNVKDSFTRMKQAQEEERKQKLEAQRTALDAANARRATLAAVRTDLAALFGEKDPLKRGKALEGVLNRLFRASGVSIREAFVLRVDGSGAVEQIDGVIEIEGEVYLVEMKWWEIALGPGEVSQHLVRVFNRGQARGIFISASGYTPAAVQTCKESLARAVFLLCELKEFVFLLEQEKDLRDFLKKKIEAAIVDKNPLYDSLKYT